MLISHIKQFIYQKSIKTAGSTVQNYFYKYCVSDYELEDYRAGKPVIGVWGVASKNYEPNCRFHGHAPAANIKLATGEMWDRYFKFCNVRNPFDMMVSWFYFTQNSNFVVDQPPFDYTFHDDNNTKLYTGIQDRISQFRAWLPHISFFNWYDDKYKIDGEPVMDFFIRFEHLYEDLEIVCNKLGVPYVQADVSHLLGEFRKHDIPISDYYNDELEAFVAHKCAWEIETFKYKMP